MFISKAAFEAIGTKWSIDCFDEISSSAWDRLQSNVRARIAMFDKAYSRFRADSWVHEIAKQPGDYTLPEDAYLMLSFYEKLYRETNGKLTPLIGRLMEDTGYDASYSLKPKATLSRPPEWKDAIWLSRNTLTLKQPALLDFGAVGKGCLVDIIAALIDSSGVENFVINAGGDLLQRGSPPVTVGLENPLDTSEAIGMLELHNQSLCASSAARRQWGNYHHIINPHSKRPADAVTATWVVADDAMTADGLATALFFTDPAPLMQEFSFDYGLLTPDMGFTHSQGFPVQLFTEPSR